MTKGTTWYRVWLWNWEIKPHCVLSSTDKTVSYADGTHTRRENIVTEHHRWFKTEADAKQWCCKEIESKIERLNDEVEELADRLEELQ